LLAQRAVDSLVKITFGHLGERLQVDTQAVRVVKNQFFFDLAIGTQRRPGQIHSCYVVTLQNEGIEYISKIEQHWDLDCSTLP
jgi:hypothetical protein